jgi:hypothetical protein
LRRKDEKQREGRPIKTTRRNALLDSKDNTSVTDLSGCQPINPIEKPSEAEYYAKEEHSVGHTILDPLEKPYGDSVRTAEVRDHGTQRRMCGTLRHRRSIKIPDRRMSVEEHCATSGSRAALKEGMQKAAAGDQGKL